MLQMHKSLLVYPVARRQPRRTLWAHLGKLVQAWALCHALCLGACHKPAAMSEAPVLAVLSNLEGVTEPCGCTSRPLGGLDRIAEALSTLRQQGPLAFVAVGTTFFSEPHPAAAMRRHEHDKAHAIAGILAKLAPARIAAGGLDTRLVVEPDPTRAALPDTTQQALHLCLNDTAQGGRCVAPSDCDASVMHLGAVLVGLVPAPTLPPAGLDAKTVYTAALSKSAQSLRQQGASLIVLLWPHGLQAARSTLDDIAAIDIVLTGSASVLVGAAQAAQAPETLGSATLLQAGARGERLGLLALHQIPDTTHKAAPTQGATAANWVFFDGHKAEKEALIQRATRLTQEAMGLAEGPGRTARQHKAQALRDAAQALPQTPPDGPYMTWQLHDIDAAQKPAAWASQALTAFNRSLCDSAKAETAKRMCTPPQTPKAAYVGTQTCQACHAEAYGVWQQTAHARAWATLTNVDKQCDLTCVGCHVVGFEKPGGFCHLGDAPDWANVGCESCHGPGAGHVAHPIEPKQWADAFVRDVPEATCRSCHNQEHSDQFDLATYRPRILGPGHGLPPKL